MVGTRAPSLAELYTEDETAWLDAMAELARRRDRAGLDWANLAEYLSDMAASDRRQVKSRLVVLLAHLIKWGHQPDKRTRSWLATVLEQRNRLADLAGRGVLRAHAEAVLAEAFAEAVELAAVETGLPTAAFIGAGCPWTVNELLVVELSADGI